MKTSSLPDLCPRIVHLRRPLATLALLMTTTVPAFANTTGGCVDSPENATLVLALLGGGVAAVGWWRKRRSRSRAATRLESDVR